MRIKEGDKWKVAFSMPEDAYELIVIFIFFRLTNLLANFQAMMNGLLRDMIEIKDVAVFIDDVMVGIETEKEYDNIVKKVLRKITENDLFAKLEKCMWKVKKMGFLRVVIGSDRIKIKKKVYVIVD